MDLFGMGTSQTSFVISFLFYLSFGKKGMFLDFIYCNKMLPLVVEFSIHQMYLVCGRMQQNSWSTVGIQSLVMMPMNYGVLCLSIFLHRMIHEKETKAY